MVWLQGDEVQLGTVLRQAVSFDGALGVVSNGRGLGVSVATANMDAVASALLGAECLKGVAADLWGFCGVTGDLCHGSSQSRCQLLRAERQHRFSRRKGALSAGSLRAFPIQDPLVPSPGCADVRLRCKLPQGLAAGCASRCILQSQPACFVDPGMLPVRSQPQVCFKQRRADFPRISWRSLPLSPEDVAARLAREVALADWSVEAREHQYCTPSIFESLKV